MTLKIMDRGLIFQRFRARPPHQSRVRTGPRIAGRV